MPQIRRQFHGDINEDTLHEAAALCEFRILEVLRQERIDFWLAGDTYATDCPGCGKQARIYMSGFKCSNKACKLVAGNAVDFLANKLRIPYDTTIARMLEYKSLAQTSAHLKFFIQELARVIEARRSVFDEIVVQGSVHRVDEFNPSVHHLYDTLTGSSYDVNAVDQTLFITSKEGWERIKESIRICTGIKVAVDIVAPVFVLPFFSGVEAISSLILYDPVHGFKEFIQIDVTARMSVFGLLQLSDVTQRTVILHNFFEVLSGNSAPTAQGAVMLVSALFGLGTSGSEVGDMLPHHAYAIEPGSAISMQQASSYAEACPLGKFTWGFSTADNTPVLSWAEVIVRFVLGSSENGELNRAGYMLLDSLVLSPTVKASVLEMLKAEGHLGLCDLLRELFSRGLAYRIGDISVYETPEGYFVQKGRSSRVRASTFTVALQTNVVFADRSEIYHRGLLFFEGKTYPFTTSAGSIDNHREFEAAAHLATMRDGSLKKVPMVTDRKSFESIGRALRSVVVGLERIEGVSSLGWTVDRKYFITPSWKMGLDGVREHEYISHPAVEVLQAFASLPTGEFSVPVMAGLKLSAMAKMFMRLIAAGIFRAFFNIVRHPLLIKQTSAIQQYIECLFSGLGQTRGISGNSSVNVITGFPVYGFASNYTATSKITTLVFLLGEKGQTLIPPAGLTEDQIRNEARHINWLIKFLAEELLANPDMTHARIPHVLYISELEAEGCAILSKLLPSVDWTAPAMAYERIERLLGSHTSDSLKSIMSYDLNRQEIHIATPPDDDLDVELRALTEQSRRTSKGVIVDASSFSDVLRHYYGFAVELPLIVTGAD